MKVKTPEMLSLVEFLQYQHPLAFTDPSDPAEIEVLFWLRDAGVPIDFNARVVTCVYCGHEYPEGTPTSQDEALTNHIKVCEKHPMRKAEETIENLRRQLRICMGD